jgi:hypothetical protein
MNTTAKNIQTTLGLKYCPDAFRSLRLATLCAARSRAGAVMLGEHGTYYVVCLADAAKMEAAGYEWAK